MEIPDQADGVHSDLAIGTPIGEPPPPSGIPPIGAFGLDTLISDNVYGFDSIILDSQSSATMQSWWNWSPYWDLGVYIGGINRPNTTVSLAFVNSAS